MRTGTQGEGSREAKTSEIEGRRGIVKSKGEGGSHEALQPFEC